MCDAPSLDSRDQHTAFKVFERITGWREIVVYKTANNEFRTVADKRHYVVHTTSEICGSLFEKQEYVSISVIAVIKRVFKNAMRIAEANEEKTLFERVESIALDEHLEPLLHAAICCRGEISNLL